MTDLEITKACAEAMEFEVILHRKRYFTTALVPYEPLHDATESMALLRKHGLALWGSDHAAGEWKWHAEPQSPFIEKHPIGHGDSPNRAICECVAKMQKAKP